MASSLYHVPLSNSNVVRASDETKNVGRGKASMLEKITTTKENELHSKGIMYKRVGDPSPLVVGGSVSVTCRTFQALHVKITLP